MVGPSSVANFSTACAANGQYPHQSPVNNSANTTGEFICVVRVVVVVVGVVLVVVVEVVVVGVVLVVVREVSCVVSVVVAVTV